ncbi:hypothetical protein FQZ97_926400 [compost metagenome]
MRRRGVRLERFHPIGQRPSRNGPVRGRRAIAAIAGAVRRRRRRTAAVAGHWSRARPARRGRAHERSPASAVHLSLVHRRNHQRHHAQPLPQGEGRAAVSRRPQGAAGGHLVDRPCDHAHVRRAAAPRRHDPHLPHQRQGPVFARWRGRHRQIPRFLDRRVHAVPALSRQHPCRFGRSPGGARHQSELPAGRP